MSFDFSSQDFDPIKALFDSSCNPPIKNAQPLPDLKSCEILLSDPLFALSGQLTASQKKKAKKRAKKKQIAEATSASTSSITPEPSQKKKSQQQQLSVTTYPDEQTMQSNYEDHLRQMYSKGPLNLLVKCLASDHRHVKIWTRRQQGVRGICTGELLSFDKHMNVMLGNVTEQYSELEIHYKKQKSIEKGVDKYRGRNRKRAVHVYQPHERFVKQMFIRGDSIIMISCPNQS